MSNYKNIITQVWNKPTGESGNSEITSKLSEPTFCCGKEDVCTGHFKGSPTKTKYANIKDNSAIIDNSQIQSARKFEPRQNENSVKKVIQMLS